MTREAFVPRMPGEVVPASEWRAAMLQVGDAVTLPDGRTGTLAAMFRDPGCGCRSVIVRLPSGRDWVGKRSEVRPA